MKKPQKFQELSSHQIENGSLNKNFRNKDKKVCKQIVKVGGGKFSKAFTLVELLGVLVVLAILGILVSQNVIDRVKQNNKQLDVLSKEVLISSARDYVYNNGTEFEKKTNEIYCLSYSNLITTEYLNEGMIPNTENIDKFKSSSVKVQYDGSSYVYEVVDKCE